MRSLSAIVEALVSARTVADIPLLTMTIVEDHSVPTLSDPVVFSDHPVQRIFSPSGIEVPFLLSVTFPTETISHLPAVTAGNISAVSRQIAFTLANIEYEGVTLFEFLTEPGNLSVEGGRMDRARLLLHTLTVPPREMGTADRHLSFIHGDFTAGDTTQFFEGRVERVVSVGDEIQCIGRSDIPQVDWKLVPDDGSAPRSRGERLPLPLGEGAFARCPKLSIGAFGTTVSRTGIEDTTVNLETFGGTLPDTGSGMLAAELLSWTGLQGDTLTGVKRGLSGSVAADHVLGTPFFVQAPIVLAVSSREITGVEALFVNGPSGQPVRVSSLLYSVNLADETTLPGSSGDPITTITFDSIQMASLLNSLFADAAVIQQAEYNDSNPDTQAVVDDWPVANQSLKSGVGARGDWTNVASNNLRWSANRTSGRDDIENFITIGLLQGAYFNSLRLCQFLLTIDVITLDEPITVGVAMFGSGGDLVGVTDGSIVLSQLITGTGVHNLSGNLLVTSDNSIVGAMENWRPVILKSDIGGGNPSIVFDVTDFDIAYTFLDDTTSFVNDPADVFTFQVGNSTKVLTQDTTVGAITYPLMWRLDLGAIGIGGTMRHSREEIAFPQAHLSLRPTEAPIDFSTTQPPDGIQLIEEMRLSFQINLMNCDPSFATRVRVSIFDGTAQILDAPVAISVHDRTDGQTASTFSITYRTDDGTLHPGITPDDLIGMAVTTWMEPVTTDTPEDAHNVSIDEITLSYDLQVKSLFAAIPREVDSQIQASSGGVTLDFFALCDGPAAPDATYIAAADELLTNPADLLHWWLRVVGEFDAADIDSAGTFATVGALLIDYKMGFDARNLGGNFQDILARMAHEARSNVTRPSGGPWKMLAAAADYSFDTPTLVLDSLSDLIAIGKDDDELRTRLTVYFGFDPRSNAATSDDFIDVQTTDPLAAEVIAREEEFGRIDEDARFLFCHTAAGGAGVTEWRLYFEQELGRAARVISARVDTWQGYALEDGDVVNLSHPKLGTGLVKARVIETQRSQQRGLLLRFAEVL